MNIIDLKIQLEKNICPEFPLILVYKDQRFVAEQYIEKIHQITNKDVNYLDEDSISSLNASSLFDTIQIDNEINVLFVDEIELTQKLLEKDNLIIVTKKVKNNIEYDKYICEIPKLQDDWVKDYLYSNMEGVDTKALDKLFEDCKKDIYRIYQECSKVKIFKQQERETLFQQMVDDQCFSDISSKNIFDFSNALLKKDLSTLAYLLQIIKVIDCEPLGLVTILYQNFRKYIQVWLSKNPTPENTGLKSNVIWAISKQNRVYSRDQLLKAFQEVCDVDRKLKSGFIETSFMVDYLTCKILTL